MEELIFAAFITSEDRSSIYPFSRTAVYSNHNLHQCSGGEQRVHRLGTSLWSATCAAQAPRPSMCLRQALVAEHGLGGAKS